MEGEELHFPEAAAGDAPEKPAPEPEAKPEAAPEKPEEEKPKEEPKPEEEKPKPEEDKEPPKDPEAKVKKRSIYDDLKDERKTRHDAETRAENAEKEAADAKAKAAELQALLDAKKDAGTPAEKAEADADLKAFAEENGLNAEGVEKLAALILKRVPKAELPAELQEKLSKFDQWEAAQKRTAEDKEILTAVPSVKEALGIEDSGELTKVMEEVVRLAHTERYHDKEVDYILFKEKATLAKLVSPKKRSFEEGGQTETPGGEAEPDFSQGAKLSPAAVQQAVERSMTGGSLSVRPMK